jgi:hypothetical protein
MTAGTDWSRKEVEAAVRDYFDMLTKELRGELFNKAEHNRRLQRLLVGRTRSAIEKKHQNISAVMIDLGYPTSMDTSGYRISRGASFRKSSKSC